MANNFAGIAPDVQTTLEGACCFDQCPPLNELQDPQFLATVYYALVQAAGIDPAVSSTADEIQAANNDAACELNQVPLCSIPPDKMKAFILFLVNELLT